MKTHHFKSFFRRLHGQEVPSFTLVELLVVVAILGLLAGLLIPVTQKAIAAGKTGKATGYLRQIGVLLNSYAGENNNCLPILINQTNKGQSPDSATAPLQFWQNLVRIQAGMSNRTVANSNTDPWLPEIFYDPAVTKSNHPWGWFWGQRLYYAWNRSARQRQRLPACFWSYPGYTPFFHRETQPKSYRGFFRVPSGILLGQ